MASHSNDPSSIRPVEVSDAPAEERTDAGTTAPRPGIEQLRQILGEGRELIARRRRPFLVVSGAVAFTLAFAILLQTPLYESTSLLLVKFGRELVYQPEVGSAKALSTRDKESVINSELAILRSRPVIHDTIRAVGLPRLYSDLAEALEDPGESPTEVEATENLVYSQAAERLVAALTAQALPEADVLQISFQHPDALVAADMVNELVDRFLEAHLEAYGEPEVVVFLEQRILTYRKRLEESETELLEFETAHAAFALDHPQAVLVQWRDETRAELAGTEGQMAAIRLRHLQEDATVSEARNTLLRLEMEATQLKGQLQKETHEQIRVVKRFIEARKVEVEGELVALREKRDDFGARLVEIERELSQLPTLSASYRQLLRQRDADEEQYAIYWRRLRDARLSNEMDLEKITSINVIQPASRAARPMWPPSKGLSLLLALVLAIVAGGLAVFAVERAGPTGIDWLDAESPREA